MLLQNNNFVFDCTIKLNRDGMYNVIDQVDTIRLQENCRCYPILDEDGKE